MNKKFTMMLAAFLAAGYTITAEAGVVKVSKPEASKTYVFGANDIYLAKGTSGQALSTSALATATQWDFTGTFAEAVLKENGQSGAGVKFDASVFKYVDSDAGTSTVQIISAEGGIVLADKNNASNVLTLPASASSGVTTGAGSVLEVYEVGKKLATVTSKALTINGKYLVISGSDIKLVDNVSYFAMGANATKWDIDSDGKIKSGTSYLCFDNATTPTKLTVGADDNAVIFETAAGYLTVVKDATTQMSKFLEVSGNEIAVKDAASTSSLLATSYTTFDAPTAINLQAPDKAVYGFPANSRLMVDIDGNTQTNGFKPFVMNADQGVETTENTEETGDNAYWSLSGNKLTNKNGIMVLSDASPSRTYQDFEIYYTSNPSTAKTFYLKVKGSDNLFVGFDGGFKVIEAATANLTKLAVFSAIAPATDPISAIDLNDINSGSFTLGYKFDDSHKATDNPFNKEMKAFYVEGDENTFYLATKWPAKYNSTTDCKVDSEEDLQENTFTFIVATPNNHWDIREFDAFGEGSKFTEVSGARLVADDYQDIKSNKHPLQNAAFGMYKVKGGNYVLTMGSLVYYSEDETETSNRMTIALVAHDNKRVVTTIETGNSEVANEVSFGATIDNLRTVQVKDFLKSDKASVFNIKFLSQNAVANDDWSSNDKATMSEYNKYLGINADGLFAQGSDFVNLSAPENQWIVVDADKDANTFTFQNRELDDVKFTAELTSTTDGTNVYVLRNTSSAAVNYAYVDKDGKYMLASEVSGVSKLSSLSGAKVQLVSVTPVAEAGYASVELDNAGLVRFAFESRTTSLVAAKSFMTAEQNKSGNSGKVAVSQEEADAAQFSLVKFDAASTSTALSDTIYAVNDYAYWANDKVNIKSDADTIAVVTYAFKQLRADGKNYYLAGNMQSVAEENDVTKAPRFIVKINKNGSYTLINATDASYVRDVITAVQTTPTVNTVVSDMTGEGTSIYYDYTSERAFDLNILKETPGTTYNHVPQHVTMEAVNGGYVAMNVENNEGIVAPVSTLKAEYTKEDLTFWLDTTDTEAVTPSFMISKAGNYMYNATDSLDYYNDGTASAEKAKEFGIQVGGNTDLLPKAIFQKADLTKVEDVENYKFQIVQSADSEDEYVIRSLNGYSYVAAHNQKLYFTSEAKEALKVVVTRVEAPTSNEGVAASEVKVVAQDGSVVVKNAAGKNVVVSTILGQVVANEVLTSDNATINVPAGIVVVAVEGESFKVNVK